MEAVDANSHQYGFSLQTPLAVPITAGWSKVEPQWDTGGHCGEEPVTGRWLLLMVSL